MKKQTAVNKEHKQFAKVFHEDAPSKETETARVEAAKVGKVRASEPQVHELPPQLGD